MLDGEKEEVRRILTSWGLEEDTVKIFIDNEMDRFALQHIDSDAVSALIHQHGLRIRFLTHQKKWVKTLSGKEGVNSSGLDSNQNQVTSCILPVLNVDDLPCFIMEDDELLVTDSANDGSDQDRDRSSMPTTATDGTDQESDRSSMATTAYGRTDQPPQNLSYDFDTVLKSSEKGKQLKSLLDKGKDSKLNDSHRSKLAECIITSELQDDPTKSLSTSRFKFLAEEITKRFPGEEKETWYETITLNKRKVSRGKLVNKFYNLRRIYIKCGLIEKEERASNASKSSIDLDSDSNDDSNAIEHNGRLLWLQNNRGPWGRVKELWKETSRARMRQLQSDGHGSVHDYVVLYPALEEEEGCQLFEIDFESRYADRTLSLFKEWTKFSSFVEREIQVKEPTFLKDDAYSPQDRVLQILLNFSKIFPPVTLRRKGTKNANIKQWRPSRAEAQDGFLLSVPTRAKLDEALEAKRDKLLGLGLSLQPLAAVIGIAQKQCLVVLDRFTYDVDSPLKAVDICFKMYHALHASYPPEAEQMWTFLQLAIYSFSTPCDKVTSNVNTLCKKYKNFT